MGDDLKLRIGPFVLMFEPGGDDDGVGIVVLELDSGERIETENGVDRDEWDVFVEAFGAR
jgi:hypothetical protein